MTREEAITRLHWLKRELIKGTDMNEPIDMAISALSAERVVRCKDCIRNNDGNFCDIAFFINDDGDGFCNCGERR